ncbi:MAG: hypothetical protein GX366_07305 [Epulopiscium sp.]|nr:hypothetical protein [Candidatus Epulonipiscium sp.]
MTDEIRKAISKKIGTFRDKSTTKLYSEESEQKFKEPCFYIKELRSSQEKELGNRYRRSHLYDIHYFPNPESKATNSDLRKMAEILYSEMELIEVSGRPLMGFELNHEIVGGVLHFFVRYPISLYKEKAKTPSMEGLKQEGGLKIDSGND